MLGLGLGLTFRPVGGGWSPLSSGDVVAWYRFDLGVATSGANITGVTDQSGVGSGKNLVSANGNPTLATDAAYGGCPVASFTGAPRLEPSGSWSASVSQAFTIYAVGQASGGSIFDGDSGHRVNLQSAFAPNWLMYAGAGFVNSGTLSNAPSVVCCVFNGASSAIYHNDFAAAAASGNPGTDPITRLAIGDLAGGVNAPLVGKVAEVVVCSGNHDATKRALFRTYFTTRYGL